ncbi:putative Phospholipase D/Transphosphatidylase [Streptomyces venezuelae]|nr:putative Phospholipase D/Transphosphatidylase [Streptomyces venezuelae]CUM36633.1 FIG00814964: hypothetical protein [Streptomyces venezuelae]
MRHRAHTVRQVEDQYLWSPRVVACFTALDELRRAGGDRVAVYGLENHAGTPVYVHAKVCVIDDVWASVGSDNINLRSWTHDSELSCAVIDESRDPRQPRDPGGLGDGARVFARDLRLELMREHLDVQGAEEQQAGAPDALCDPATAFGAFAEAAAALDAWHEAGRRGPRPPGRLRGYGPRPLRDGEGAGDPSAPRTGRSGRPSDGAAAPPHLLKQSFRRLGEEDVRPSRPYALIATFRRRAGFPVRGRRDRSAGRATGIGAWSRKARRTRRRARPGKRARRSVTVPRAQQAVYQ